MKTRGSSLLDAWSLQKFESGCWAQAQHFLLEQCRHGDNCWCTNGEIFSNKTKIRLYLPFSDSFWTKQTSVWFQINRKMVNTIRFQVDLIRIRKYFSVHMSMTAFPVELIVIWYCLRLPIVFCFVVVCYDQNDDTFLFVTAAFQINHFL